MWLTTLPTAGFHLNEALAEEPKWNRTVINVIGYTCLLTHRLYTYLGLIGFDQDFADLEVEHLIIPSTGQHVVTHTGQRVTHEEISITYNQSLWHLDREKKERKMQIALN